MKYCPQSIDERCVENFGGPLKILMVEDNFEFAATLTQFFEETGHDIYHLQDGERLFEKIEDLDPDIVLLDQILPGKSGQDLLQEMRSQDRTREFPVIMITGVGADSDQLHSLNLGADDYITKPFSPEILLVRIMSVLRRSRRPKVERLTCGDLSIDLEAQRVLNSGKEVELTSAEFKILAELLLERGKVLSREKLKKRALGGNHATDRTVDVHVSAIRRKLNATGQAIQTVRGVGYRFVN